MMKRAPILLVEDNPDDVKLTLKAFQLSKVLNPVDVAFDGVEAMEYLEGTGKFATRDAGVLPACILLDIKMPRMDGLEFLQRIRTDSRWNLIPVVILTTSSEDRDRIESYKLGANGYVRKPVRLPQFIEAVQYLSIYWLVINTPPYLELDQGVDDGKLGTLQGTGSNIQDLANLSP